jgi:hypothetical protein
VNDPKLHSFAAHETSSQIGECIGIDPKEVSISRVRPCPLSD